MILSIDPGDSTGLATFSRKGELLERWIMSAEDTIDYLSYAEGITAIVCEDFRLRHGRAVAQSGSKLITVQVIGAVKLYCKIHHITLIMQGPDILPVAALHSGVAQPSNHALSHDIDAYNHGYYYFEKIGVLKPKPRILR